MNDQVKQKIVAQEMQQLMNHKHKNITVSRIREDRPLGEEMFVLKDVTPCLCIEVQQDEFAGMVIVFIGYFEGITKIIATDTGDVLYENTGLTFPRGIIDEDAQIKHTNKLREAKYGSSDYNLRM